MAFVLRALKPGQNVDLVFLHEGKKITQKVTIGDRPK
jgi:S1-C subfamily serine protease